MKELNVLAGFSPSDVANIPQGLTFFVNWGDKNRNIVEIRLHLDK